MFIVVGFILLLIFAVLIIGFMQQKHPKLLPHFLKDWTFLPLPLRSLEPYDKLVVHYLFGFKCCRKLTVVSDASPVDDTAKLENGTTTINGQTNQAFVVDIGLQRF